MSKNRSSSQLNQKSFEFTKKSRRKVFTDFFEFRLEATENLHEKLLCPEKQNIASHQASRTRDELFQLSRFRINCLINNKFMSLFFCVTSLWLFSGSRNGDARFSEWLFMADWSTVSLNVESVGTKGDRNLKSNKLSGIGNGPNSNRLNCAWTADSTN